MDQLVFEGPPGEAGLVSQQQPFKARPDVIQRAVGMVPAATRRRRFVNIELVPFGSTRLTPAVQVVV
jgi:hypothetical protein